MHTQIDKESGPSSTTEATQFHQAQAGCPSSLNALMAYHDGLVQTIVRQQVLGGLPFTEALQAGRVGLWRAIQGFDPTRGLAFSTYAWPCIMRQVWREVKAHDRFSARSAISDVHISLDAADPAMVWEAEAVRQVLDDAVQRLVQRLRHVIVRRYGLNGDPPAIYRQIGADLDLTGERVRQLHTEALVLMRQPSHSYILYTLLERHTLADYEAANAQAQRWLRRRGGRRGS